MGRAVGGRGADLDPFRQRPRLGARGAVRGPRATAFDRAVLRRHSARRRAADFATSLVAEGKVNVASRGGKPLPPDSLIGPDGALSGDPALLYGPLDRDGPRSVVGLGAIRAFGEHKGSGLALICELLGGSLTANGATGPQRKFANGMFSLYVDPKQVDPSQVFNDDMSRYLDWFRQAKTLPGEAILTPGEPERTARAQRSAQGVPLPSETWASIVAAARSVGVKPDVPSELNAKPIRALPLRPRSS